MKTFKIQGDDISDGYHTFGELYDHRCTLFLVLCLKDAENCAWRPDYQDWFCLYWQSPAGQISYHLPNRFLDLVKGRIRQVKQGENIYDGHTSSDVLWRLEALALKELKAAGRSA